MTDLPMTFHFPLRMGPSVSPERGFSESPVKSLATLADLGLPLPRLGVKSREETLKSVAEALIAWSPSWKDMTSYLQFDPRGYARRRMAVEHGWEVLLLCWLPEQATVIHDHGDSLGAVRILFGSLVEDSYRWTGSGIPLERLGRTASHEGDLMTEGPETIHQIRNEASVPAASLHIYGPPLRFFHAYDADTGSRKALCPPMDSGLGDVGLRA